MRAWTLVLLLAAGCDNNGWGDEDPNNNNNGLDDPGDNPDELVYEDRCDGYTDSEDGQFYPVAGATTYWIGNLQFTAEGDVIGTERIEILPNTTWEDANPDDAIRCKVVWTASGYLDFDNKCASCDYRIIMDAFKDEGSSTCAPAFTASAYDDTMTGIQYDVRNTCSGNTCTSIVTFATSGNEFATGEANDNGIVYNSGSSCAFY